jgi:hypothetical protein
MTAAVRTFICPACPGAEILDAGQYVGAVTLCECPTCGGRWSYTGWGGYTRTAGPGGKPLERQGVARSWELSDWQRADLRLP